VSPMKADLSEALDDIASAPQVSPMPPNLLAAFDDPQAFPLEPVPFPARDEPTPEVKALRSTSPSRLQQREVASPAPPMVLSATGVSPMLVDLPWRRQVHRPSPGVERQHDAGPARTKQPGRSLNIQTDADVADGRGGIGSLAGVPLSPGESALLSPAGLSELRLSPTGLSEVLPLSPTGVSEAQLLSPAGLSELLASEEGDAESRLREIASG
jgi:hypothetical protein